MSTTGPESTRLEVYKCRDMGVCTYLRTIGFSVQEVDWVNFDCVWTFVQTPGLMAKVDEYVSGMAFVDPHRYFQQMRVTRQEFYDAKHADDDKASER